MFFSIIIPVFNRPLEIKELLESLVNQVYQDFEVIVVEDGSTFTSEDIVFDFHNRLNVKYFFIDNVGQGFARNFGMQKAKGDYFVLFDSDCIIPEVYLNVLKSAIQERRLDAHGGPDAASQDFSVFQKAVNYSMTSFLTTGGIRGKMKDPKKYQARGYNMGLSKAAFQRTKGFIDPNKAEDIELSIRLKKEGFKSELVDEAYVYHKRKESWESFISQAFSFGQNRVHVSKYHPEAIKFVHLLPSFFFLGLVLTLLFVLMQLPVLKWLFIFYGIWALMVGIDAGIKERSFSVGLTAIFTSFCQLIAYGLGLLSALFKKLFNWS